MTYLWALIMHRPRVRRRLEAIPLAQSRLEYDRSVAFLGAAHRTAYGDYSYFTGHRPRIFTKMLPSAVES